MQINEVQLTDKSNLINDYREENEAITSFFDYKPFESYETRLKELKSRTFNRKGLTNVLDKMNRSWGANEHTLNNIEQLKGEEAVVVIGGQQAGLLTGPMYTVNKIISIITLAKQQAVALNVPVIPVFWIAGEDHDYDEINHIYTNRNNAIHKHIVGQRAYLKHSLSHLEMSSAAVEKWLAQSFQYLKETTFTKDIYHVILNCLERSTTYVDFCARLIFALFPDEGIVLIDSGHDDVRRLEANYFEQLITKQPEVAQSVYETIQELQQKDYDVPLEVTEHDAHLFYHDNNNERILLFRSGDKWVGKNEEVVLTTDELLAIARDNPTRLSNNVVTRPLIQDLLFPTISFVAGDGEISYWASLKKLFHVFNVKMPPVIPRLSMTYIPTRIDKLLEKREITAESVVNSDINFMKDEWFKSQQEQSIDQLFEKAKEDIRISHQPLQEAAQTVGADIVGLADKNLEYLTRQLTFLENKMLNGLKENHRFTLDQFNEIAQTLKPNQVLQERIWSPLPFVNESGIAFIKKVINSDLSFENSHYFIHLD